MPSSPGRFLIYGDDHLRAQRALFYHELRCTSTARSTAPYLYINTSIIVLRVWNEYIDLFCRHLRKTKNSCMIW